MTKSAPADAAQQAYSQKVGEYKGAKQSQERDSQLATYKLSQPTLPPHPLTKQQVEDKYWLEFMEWYAKGVNRLSYTGSITDKFWTWLAVVKVPSIKVKNGWQEL